MSENTTPGAQPQVAAASPIDLLRQAREAMEAARGSHGVSLTSYPPQDAWVARGVEQKLRAAIAAIDGQIDAPAGTDEVMVFGRAGNRRVDLEAVLRDALAHEQAAPAATSGDLYEAFKAAFLSWNGFHTESELAVEWLPGSLSGEMFRAGAATHASADEVRDAATPAPSEPTKAEVDAEVEGYRRGYVEGMEEGALLAATPAAQDQADQSHVMPLTRGTGSQPDVLGAVLHSTMDAQVWATEFCRLNNAADHGMMLAWFANAIMVGWDFARRSSPAASADAVVDAKDAARYRWFKDNYLKYGNSDPDIRRPIVLFEGRWYGGHFDNMTDLDAAIDEAMSGVLRTGEGEGK